jgi:hypothetical protein
MDSKTQLNIVDRNANRENEIKIALLKLYDVTMEPFPEPKSRIELDAAERNAVGILAVECAVKLFNALISVRKPNEGLGHKALMDFAVGLNDNLFWMKHAGRLMPLVHMALSAQTDFAILQYEKDKEPNIAAYDRIMYESELMGLEILVMIHYLLNGPDKTATKSLEIKRRMFQYLVA